MANELTQVTVKITPAGGETTEITTAMTAPELRTLIGRVEKYTGITTKRRQDSVAALKAQLAAIEGSAEPKPKPKKK